MSANPTFSFGVHTETLWIESTSARLFTTVYPRQNAETVILLHGGPGVPMDFSPVAELLSRKYQVIAFDQRGTGRSPARGATFSIEEYLKDVNAITHHLAVNKFHLFGHSWGGLYAQIYAERNPQKVLSMFLCSPSSGTGELWKQTESEVLSFNKGHSNREGWSMMGIKAMFGMLGSDAATQSLFKQVLENYNKEFDPTFTATDEMVKNVRAEPVNKTRRQILKYPLLKESVDPCFPIIVTYGQKDIYGASKQEVKNRFPRAVFMEIENTGHIPWRHNPGKFNNILFEFYRIQMGKN